MVKNKIDIHQVFADYFDEKLIREMAYECSKRLSEGHICVDLAQYNLDNSKTVSSDELLKSSWVTNTITDNKPFVLKNNRLYLHRYFQYETEILASIEQFISNENPEEQFKHLQLQTEFIKTIFPQNLNEINWQLIAVLMAFLHQFSIITGGPGTGKTTSIAKFLSLVYKIKPDTKVAVVAPTGKASARIKESILLAKNTITNLGLETQEQFENINSSTIHRLLGYQKGTHYFKHNAQNPLNFDIVIVDESSMMGVSLMAKLLNAIAPGKKVILLGDKDQLASVEAGSIFGDICQSQKEQTNRFSESKLKYINAFLKTPLKADYLLKAPAHLLSDHIVELRKSFRFDPNKGIGLISSAILNGSLNSDKIQSFMDQKESEVRIFTEYHKTDLESFFNYFISYIQEKDPQKALHRFNESRILCPTHEGKWSVDDLNKKVEWYLASQQLLSPQNGFYHNQPIIINKNDYHLQLFNGDVGLIRKDENGNLQAYFESEEGGLKSYNPNYLGSYTTVFAMTIHKSQGSEFEHVAVVLPEQEDLPLLSRELLYTGLTRAKKHLLIFAKTSILEQTSQKPVQRASGIGDRLRS